MHKHALLLAGLLTFGLPACAAESVHAPLKTVENLDLERYQGRWYEIARLPNRFQDDCAGDVRVNYTLRSDGRVDVLNQCAKSDGDLMSAEGVARQVQEDGPNSELEVRFAPAWLSFLPMVWGDYYVIDLADDYSWAVVGHPERTYFWILSRSPRLDETIVNKILDRAKAQGYTFDDLIRTRHSGIAAGEAHTSE
jgi:apolipoprotein D and lipocalin family protein